MTLIAWILIILGLLFIWLGLDIFLKSRDQPKTRTMASNPILEFILKLLGWLLDQPGGGWILMGMLFIAVGGNMLSWWDIGAIVDSFGSVDEETLRLLFSA